MSKHWLITNQQGIPLHTCPILRGEDSGNDGMPEWVFARDDLIAFEVSDTRIEWWPPMGPAPSWKGQLHGDWFARFLDWYGRTY